MVYSKATRKKRAKAAAKPKKRPRPKVAKTKRKISRKTVQTGKPKPTKIAVIADIHSNLEALEAVLKHIESQGGILKILCAGDIIGYGPNPNECCWTVQKLGIAVVQGNHDLNIDLKDMSRFNRNAQIALAWTEGKITQKNRIWLLNLPMVHKERLQGMAIYMVHGSPEDPHYEYTTEHTPKYVMKHWLDDTKSDVIIVGHTHQPFVKKIGSRLIINAGSVGQPRDGDPSASYALLDLKAFTAKIVRVPYNTDAVAEKIKETTLPGQLADRLYDGI